MGKGKKIIRQAEEMGFKELPLTVFYGRPRKVKMTFSKNIPDYVAIIRDWFTGKDPETLFKVDRGGRTRRDIFLSTKEKIYVENLGKMSGFAGMDPENHLFEVSFWTENDEIIREFVKSIDQRFSDVGGILQHINWEKIRKKYKVDKEDCLLTWNKYLP